MHYQYKYSLGWNETFAEFWGLIGGFCIQDFVTRYVFLIELVKKFKSYARKWLKWNLIRLPKSLASDCVRQRQRASANSELERQTKYVVDMAALKEEKKFAKDLMGDDFLKFKIALEVREKGQALVKHKILIPIARKEAASLTKLKQKISRSLDLHENFGT